MKVTHIVGGSLDGGAARGTRILHEALLAKGVQSILLTPDRSQGLPGVVSVDDGAFGWLRRRVLHGAETLRPKLYRDRKRQIFSSGAFGHDLMRRPEWQAADVIHLHWINQGMLSIAGIGAIDRPSVWSMRDMWPFTGGCHYTGGCRKFETVCGSCPALGSNNERDLAYQTFQRKTAHTVKKTLVVGISDWLAQQAQSSALLAGCDIRSIHNAVDTQAFQFMPTAAARSALDLPQNRPIALRGALNITDTYKGAKYFNEASLMFPKDAFVCSFGFGEDSQQVDRSFGFVHDLEKLRLIYAAADVLVFPSVEEAFGKVVAEAMACGTPPVVFGNSGPGEIVTHKETGFIAGSLGAFELAEGVKWLLEDPNRLATIGKAAAASVAERMSPSRAAEAYIKTYQEAICRFS